MTDDHGPFLAAIISRPDDDLPRLMYCDWLEEHATPDQCICKQGGHRECTGNRGNGYAERAEFIRVQVKLASLERETDDLLGDEKTDWRLCDSESGIAASWCPNCGDCCCPNREDRMDDPACPLHNRNSKHCRLSTIADRIAAIRRRERKLSVWQLESLVKVFPGVWSFSGNEDWRLWADGRPTGSQAYFRRGFVESVTCTADDWLVHGDTICAATPISEVTLTTRVEQLSALSDLDFLKRRWPRVKTWNLPHLDFEATRMTNQMSIEEYLQTMAAR